jgi:hypothetical protein
MAKKTVVGLRLEKFHNEYWPTEMAWTGRKLDGEVGWFPAPRTLPLVLDLITVLVDKGNPATTYIELLSRQRGEGVVEIEGEESHAYAAGYGSTKRGTRTWREHMRALVKLGFIKAVSKNNRPYGLILIVHPTIAVGRLRDQNLLPPGWWDTYRQRQIACSERSYEDLLQEQAKNSPPPPPEAALVVSDDDVPF